MPTCKLTCALLACMSVGFTTARQISCEKGADIHRDHALLQVAGQSNSLVPKPERLLQFSAGESAVTGFGLTRATLVLRLKTFRQDPANVASVIQCGIQGILSAIMHFTVTPPRVNEGIVNLGDDILTCIEKIVTPQEQAQDEYERFKGAWQAGFNSIHGTAVSVESDIAVYMLDGYAPALIRAIATIIGEGGEIVSNFLPVDVAHEVKKYLDAVVELFDTMGTSWDEFAKGNTVGGVEAIYWGLRSITDGVMSDVFNNNTVYDTIIGTLDFVLGNLSHHVLEYERLILESNVCWRTEKNRGKVRPMICPSEQYFSDGQGSCYPLESSLLDVGQSSASSLDTAVQRKGGHDDGGFTPSPSVIPAQCDLSTEFTEKHGHYCYNPCMHGWQIKDDNIHKCISTCEGRFPAETPAMCGRDSGIITKAILEMVTVVLNSAFSLADNIIRMQEKGVNAELLVSTIQVFIDMGKPFARPMCPEGEAPTPAPNPIACSRPCDYGVLPGLCRLETGGLVICLPAGETGACAAGQLACPPTPAPTFMLETSLPTPYPTVWENGGRRRAQLPTQQSTPSPTVAPSRLPTFTIPVPTLIASTTPNESSVSDDDISVFKF